MADWPGKLRQAFRTDPTRTPQEPLGSAANPAPYEPAAPGGRACDATPDVGQTRRDIHGIARNLETVRLILLFWNVLVLIGLGLWLFTAFVAAGANVGGGL